MDCDTGDCDCIQANINYYEAAITVDQAALNVAQNQLLADQASYWYWQYRSYMEGCGTSSSSSSGSSESSSSSSSDPGMMMSLGPVAVVRSRAVPPVGSVGRPPVTPEQFKNMVDGIARMNQQYGELLAKYNAAVKK